MAKKNSIVLKNMPIYQYYDHIDHGKTTLTTAIAAVLAKMVTQLHSHVTLIDNAQKKERGITVMHFSLSTDDRRHYAHVICRTRYSLKHDHWCCSNGRRYLSVVSAADGPMP